MVGGRARILNYPRPVTGQRIEVEGTVQGVGFRPWVHRVATGLGLRGVVFNTPRGVVVDAFGSPAALDALGAALRTGAPRAAHVRRVVASPLAGEAPEGFTIVASEYEGARSLTVPADLATCDACAAEVDDPRDRHFGYAFTSCTECGPRYSVVEDLPYDRARTTLRAFPLCPECAREYGDLGDRRFHAQAIACPRCGPRLWLEHPTGGLYPTDAPIAVAAERLSSGGIVGVQGLGGFHLACDATDAAVVDELRRRKHRDDKPFAVMVADLAAARRVAELDEEAAALLTSAARPIVLAPARPSAVTGAVRGPSSRLGVFLPYTPLHQLLLRAVGRPLVMTSGNRSGEPIAVTHAEARAALGGIVDLLLLHDRPIVRRVEDSVVGPRVLRRARGYAPDAIRLPAAAPEPVLGVGGHLKNTACLVLGDHAYVTPHLGDLETWESEQAFRADVERFEALLGVRAQVVAHDLHPEYASTRYALARGARRTIGVQHHVAHVLAAVAELHLEGPVLGVVFDGTGFGTDGTAWGAEVLRVDGLRWSRPGSFRPLALPGGERAIRETWRLGSSALHEAFGADEAAALATRLPVFSGLDPVAVGTIGRMLAASVQCVGARGMGRWFDAVGALVLGLPEARFEGHVAMALEEAAGGELGRPYPFVAPRAAAVDAVDEEHEVDLRPTIRAVVEDVLDGVSTATIAARFHGTIVAATAGAVARLRGGLPVVLSGGSLQNRILERGLVDALGGPVYLAKEVPVNDGGLSLGQAWAAVLAARGDATTEQEGG